MRRMISTLGLLGFLAAAGCHHVGGKCDCGPQPGDAALYAPYNRDPAPLSRTYEPIRAPLNETPR